MKAELEDILSRNSQEDFFETLHDIFQERVKRNGSAIDMIALTFCAYTSLRIFEQLPGNPRPKDFGDETIGERVERNLRDHSFGEYSIAAVVDGAIADAVVTRKLKEWRNDKAD